MKEKYITRHVKYKCCAKHIKCKSCLDIVVKCGKVPSIATAEDAIVLEVKD